eukprot:c19995_g1_i1.p1 GENE.c19995_g1_i1~~c19995_g1_i1.p1  ORF type:complete len:181 (+),score=43.63 c19995_g1_i1:41-544(+)
MGLCAALFQSFLVLGISGIQFAITVFYFIVYEQYKDITSDDCYRPLHFFCLAAALVTLISVVITLVSACYGTELPQWVIRLYFLSVFLTIIVWLGGLFLIGDTFVNGPMPYSFSGNCDQFLFDSSMLYFLSPFVVLFFVFVMRIIRRNCKCVQKPEPLAEYDGEEGL